MLAWYFSECPYPFLPDPVTYESIRVSLPNRHYDPRLGAELYNQRLDEWKLADAEGLNLMVNEHHQTPTCIVPAGPLLCAILARETTHARIVLLGNPIANRPDPVRVAEEMAMIDNLSHGRLEVGFVRGVPYEIAPANANPALNHERMWEAYDLIVRAWTHRDGPFSWEGEHFHYRQVNIWPRPYQQPHPPIWISTTSAAGAARVGELGHVAATFLTGREQTQAVFRAYRDRRKELGLSEPGLDRFAYLAMVYTAETEAEAHVGARKLLWYLESNKVAPQFRQPPGYLPAAVAARMARGDRSPRAALAGKGVEELVDLGILFAGTPDQVYDQISTFYRDVGGFGHLLLLGQTGEMTQAEASSALRLFAREVRPRLADLGAAADPGIENAAIGRGEPAGRDGT